MSAPNERELLEFGERLSHYAKVAPRPEFRSRLRSSLLAAPVAFETPRRSPLGWSRVLALRPALAVILVLVLLAAAGGGAASATSLPGDPAFALKRAVEDVQVTLASDDVARLNALVTQSDRRLADLETLVSRRSAAVGTGTDEYAAAVTRIDEVVSRVAALPASSQREAALARASAASTDHLARLQALAARLPEEAQRGIQRAIEVQQRVHGKSGDAPGRGGIVITPTTGRGGSPSGVPARP
ncbi:MAG: hypothetical protein E6J15_06980 [Chloroflexi bacterium]|nr:MAG: hypothetical protein E6J15_06980 [Chloroflexota bacterium]